MCSATGRKLQDHSHALRITGHLLISDPLVQRHSRVVGVDAETEAAESCLNGKVGEPGQQLGSQTAAAVVGAHSDGDFRCALVDEAVAVLFFGEESEEGATCKLAIHNHRNPFIARAPPALPIHAEVGMVDHLFEGR